MPLEDCPFLRLRTLNHCFPCGYGSNPTKKGEKAVNVSFVIDVRHVFVVFGNVRNPECGIRNPFPFVICGKSFRIYNIFCISFF